LSTVIRKKRAIQIAAAALCEISVSCVFDHHDQLVVRYARQWLKGLTLATPAPRLDVTKVSNCGNTRVLFAE